MQSKTVTLLSLFFSFWLLPRFALSQQLIEVQDAATNTPLIGAHVHVLNSGEITKTFITDVNGEVLIPKAFVFEKKLRLHISYIGYEADTVFVESTPPGERANTVSGSDQKITLTLNRAALQLDEAAVTGQYNASSVDDAVQNIHIITRDKMDKMAAVTLDDVLQNELNIRLSQDMSLGTSMTMQGISGENVKLLIDGVPMIGRLDGNIDLSQINLQNIERIEIVKGPLSVNYGTNALAGTINLITKSGRQQNNQLRAGSYVENVGKANVFADYHYHNNNHIIQLAAGRNFFSGWSPQDAFLPDFERPVADTSRTKMWNPRTQYFADAGYTYQKGKSKLTYSSRVFQETILNRGAPRPPYLETAFDEYFNTFRLDNGINYQTRLKNNAGIQLIAAYNYFRRDRETYFKNLTTGSRTLSEQKGSQNTDEFDLLNIRGTYTRAPHKTFNYETGFDINRETSLGPRIEGEQQEIGDYAVFASAEYKPVKKITLRPGLRYAYNTMFTSVPLPSFNALWKITPTLSWRSSYARGFRAPTLKEMYFYFVDVNHNIIGNENLEVETSNNYSTGFRYKKAFSKMVVRAEANAFYNDISNLITLAQIEDQQFSYVNAGAFKTAGTEVRADFIMNNLKITGGFTYTGRDQGFKKESGIGAFAFYPEWQFNISKTIEKPDITLSYFFKYQGELPGFAINANEELIPTFIESYSMSDITLNKSWLQKTLKTSIGVKNLFNVTQVNAARGSGGVHSAGSGSVPTAMGRLLFLRLQYSINQKSKNNESK